ncbi:MAG: hypothetical protein LUC26_03015 [Prevotella sp.]|nr:hypothetical protein [Prevotella sp.]
MKIFSPRSYKIPRNPAATYKRFHKQKKTGMPNLPDEEKRRRGAAIQGWNARGMVSFDICEKVITFALKNKT